MKKLEVKQRTYINTFSLLISLLFAVVVAYKGGGYWALVCQQLTQQFLIVFLYFRVTHWRPSIKIDFKPLKPMFAFGSKILYTGIFIIFSGNFINLLLGKIFSITQLGYYTQGNKWANMGNTFVSNTLNLVSQPVFLDIHNDKKRQLNAFHKMMRFGAFLSFPILFGIALIGKEFILLAIGSKWLDSVFFLQLFCIYQAFGFISTLYLNLITNTYGKSNIYMIISTVTGICQILVVVLSSQFGIKIMATAFVIVSLMSIFAWQYFAKKIVSISFLSLLKDILPFMFASILCCSVGYFATLHIPSAWLTISLKIVITAGLYFLILRLTNAAIYKESIAYLKENIKSKVHHPHS
jgi:O-antigen/teichoic acid export membrane protein